MLNLGVELKYIKSIAVNSLLKVGLLYYQFDLANTGKSLWY